MNLNILQKDIYMYIYNNMQIIINISNTIFIIIKKNNNLNLNLIKINFNKALNLAVKISLEIKKYEEWMIDQNEYDLDKFLNEELLYRIFYTKKEGLQL